MYFPMFYPLFNASEDRTLITVILFQKHNYFLINATYFITYKLTVEHIKSYTLVSTEIKINQVVNSPLLKKY